jgi:hypothetical protein
VDQRMSKKREDIQRHVPLWFSELSFTYCIPKNDFMYSKYH